ncbi:MAG: PAS domain S-box protein [Phycisphaerae bacterium]|nr:PAS domain S-box protein [Phycisphaerae bacterium]
MGFGSSLDYLLFGALALLGLGLTEWTARRWRRLRVISPLVWCLAAAVLMGGWFLVNHAGNQKRHHVRMLLEGLARTYAMDLSRMGHSRLSLDTDPQDPQYLRMIEAQIRWLKAKPVVADIYTLRPLADGTVALLVDSETDYDGDGCYSGDREARTPIGTPFGSPTPGMSTALRGKPDFNDSPHTDSWGTWISAAVPLLDEAGHVEAILGVNYHADEWRRAIATSRLLSIAFIAVLLVILVASSVTSALYHAQLNENQRARQARTQSEALLHATINSSQDAIITTDSAGVILTFNPAAEAMFGRTAEEMVGQKFSTLLPPEQRRGYDELLSLYLATKTPLGTISRLLELSAARRGGELFPIEVSLSAGEAAGQHFVTAVIRDITHRKQIEEELATHRQQLEHLVAKHSERLLAAQRQLLHNEKLASVGQLAAGVAHEINTPIQYVGDNLRALSESFDDLLNIQNKYRELVTLVKTGLPTEETISAIEAAASECDLDFLIEDTPKAIAQGLEGVARVTHIVRAMKDFSHVDRGEVSAVDINHALESTLTVARNEYKYVADIETDFGQLPPVECFASEMNQVFLNVLVNAAQAIAETGRRGTITLRTRHIADQVEVTIHDTGAGIPEAVRAKVFDPFYTTKAVGKGSGQGLNIAHQIVVRRHGGTIDFDTETGTGTTFVIRIPVRMPAGAESRQGDV